MSDKVWRDKKFRENSLLLQKAGKMILGGE